MTAKTRRQQIEEMLAQEPDDAELGATADAVAQRDARDHADHVLEVRHVLLRPRRRVGEPRAIGGAVQHLDGSGRIQEQVFRAAGMGAITPRFLEAVDGDALLAASVTCCGPWLPVVAPPRQPLRRLRYAGTEIDHPNRCAALVPSAFPVLLAGSVPRRQEH